MGGVRGARGPCEGLLRGQLTPPPQGPQDESTGAVPLGNLRGDALANAYMKCETKAKRRVC
jgi:hypothetical protein